VGIMKQSIRSKQGSVLMATVGIALVGATVIGGYLTMVNSEYKLAQRTLQLQGDG
jgi:nucleoside permease NupC